MAPSLERLAGKRLERAVRTLLVTLGFSTIVLPFVGRVPVLRHLAWPLETWFAWQCHREVGRTFLLFGQAMPVCSRCFGIYLGLGLGALILRPRLEVWPLRIWVAFGAVAMLLDVATEGLAMRPPSGWVRQATGLVLSYPVGAALVLAARGDEPAPPVTASGG